MSDKEKIRKDIDLVAVALCADYERRKRFIDNRLGERRVRMEYAYINSKIFDAASEIVGQNEALIYIEEIGRRIGYAHSALEYVSETTYKINKAQIKENILKKIYYIDSMRSYDGFISEN